jgi:hypothetical protein
MRGIGTVSGTRVKKVFRGHKILDWKIGKKDNGSPESHLIPTLRLKGGSIDEGGQSITNPAVSWSIGYCVF